MLSVVMLRSFTFCGLELLPLFAEILLCRGAVTREKVTVIEGLKKCVASGTLSSTRYV